MKYLEVVKLLKTYIPIDQTKWNKDYGLDKIKFFLEQLGNPQSALKFVHIGGTSGKGSTATFLAAILSESGYKTGLHVSPDTITVRERMQINGVCISKERFIEIFELVKPAIPSVLDKFGRAPSYYEILLAMAFVYFKIEQCRLVVLEVGLGGRLDSTNIIDCSYQIITNVGLDHTAILGDTKELILKDKREIIKPSSVVVSGIGEPDLQKIIQEKVSATASKLYLLGTDFKIENINKSLDGNVGFDLTSVDFSLENLRPSLKGLFQVQNAAVAAMMAKQLSNEFQLITDKAIDSGIARANIPGRFQIFSTNPLGIVDGAHNPDKVVALVKSLQYYYPGQKFITIFRYKKRADIDQSLTLLRQVSSKIILTKSHKLGDMGLDPTFDSTDQDKYKNDDSFIFEASLSQAYKSAIQYAKDNNYGILVTGSLLMINEFLQSTKQL